MMKSWLPLCRAKLFRVSVVPSFFPATVRTPQRREKLTEKKGSIFSTHGIRASQENLKSKFENLTSSFPTLGRSNAPALGC